MKQLSDELYNVVAEKVPFPIPTVDYIPVRGGSSQREFLLGRRANRPYRGKWSIFGGRVSKGETLERALWRIVREEIGLNTNRLRTKFLGCHTVFNPPNNFGVRLHALSHLYLIWFRGTVKISRENSAVRWFNDIRPQWPKPVKKMLRMAGFKEAK